MKALICYPMKSLVGAFMPERCDALTVEKETELSQMTTIYQPDVAVLFSEYFSSQVWEWLPQSLSMFSEHVVKIIIPLHRDERLVKKIVSESHTINTYVLSASLTYVEIKKQLEVILGLGSSHPETTNSSEQAGSGKVFNLLSYGSAGVTTFCINYPVLLAKSSKQKQIAVIDMNTVKPDLSRFFGLHEHQLSLFRPDLLDLRTAEKRNWKIPFKQSKAVKNLFYSSGTSKWKSYEISNLVHVLRKSFDYVYLDWGYCFPETEALLRIVKEADYNVFFARADPFSIESAHEWVGKWKAQGVNHQLLVSHFDREAMSKHHIRESLHEYGILPRVPENRIIHSHQQKSVLVDELFPPKQYLQSLLEMVDSEKSIKGVTLC